MRRSLLITALCFFAGTAAEASPYITLAPSSMQFGDPGSIVGWGFIIHPDDTQWISIHNVLMIENGPIGGPVGTAIVSCGNPFAPLPCNGFLFDILGPVDFALPSVADGGFSGGDWSVAFNPSNGSGLAEYIINPGTPVGSFDGGVDTYFQITYDTYSGDPITGCGGGGCPQTNLGGPLPVLLQDGSKVVFSILVVPEPATMFPVGIAAALLLWAIHRRRA